MRIKRATTMAASLLCAVPAIADNLPSHEECESGVVEWLFHSELVESLVRVDGRVAVTVNREILDSLEADARRHVENCLEVLRVAPSPEDWPLQPDEEI